MARYLIDANLPRRLTIWHDTAFEWVSDHDDRWSDSQVWDYARLNDLVIVTKDADFSNRVMLSAPPPRVVAPGRAGAPRALPGPGSGPLIAVR